METAGQHLIALFKAHRAYLSRHLAALGLYTGQEGLLYHLKIADGQTMGALAEKLQIQQATLFTMVARMEKAGWVRKEKHETDKRASRIFLTAQGREKTIALAALWQQTEAQLLQNFSAAEKERLFEMLQKLTHNLKPSK